MGAMVEALGLSKAEMNGLRGKADYEDWPWKGLRTMNQGGSLITIDTIGIQRYRKGVSIH